MEAQDSPQYDHPRSWTSVSSPSFTPSVIPGHQADLMTPIERQIYGLSPPIPASQLTASLTVTHSEPIEGTEDVRVRPPPAPALDYPPSPQSLHSLQSQVSQAPQIPGESKSLMANVDKSNNNLASQPNLDNDESKEQENEREKALHSTNVKRWIYALTIVTYLLAVVFAIAHHLYLSSLNHHPISRFSVDAQRWVLRVSNYFGMIVVICLGVVATTALVQGAWNRLNAEHTPISVIDDIFSLPSPVAVVSLLKETKFQLYQLVVISVLFQALALVSTLAPNALSIGGNLVTRNITVPKLDMTTALTNMDQIWWIDLTSYFMRNSPAEAWTVPDCGDFCTFDVEYQAPGISCRTLSPEETYLPPFSAEEYAAGGWWTFYEGSFIGGSTWRTNNFLNFSLLPFNATYSTSGSSDYEVPVNITQTGPIQGQLCEFQDRTYKASFSYSHNVKVVSPLVTSDTNELNRTCGSWTNLTSTDCIHYTSTAMSMIGGFMNLFFGRGIWKVGGIVNKWSVLDLSGIIKYQQDLDHKTISLTSPPIDDPNSNFTKAVEDAFANVVLGILLQFNQTGPQSVLVEEGNAWIFDSFILWIVYGPALFLVLVAGGFGLYWVYIGNITREKNFSSFFVTTRSKELFALSAQPISALMASKIKYDGEMGRFLVQSEVDKQKEPECETLLTNNGSPTGSPREAKDIPHDAETKDWTKITIIAGFILAIVFAFGHHFYLRALNGHKVHLQFWVKNVSNAFSHAVSMCLGVAAGASLTQAIWRSLKLHGGSVKTIDDLFDLPSPLATTALIRYPRKVQIIYVIITAGVIQALALITSIAPTALGIGTTPYTTRGKVPTLDLSKLLETTSENAYYMWGLLIQKLVPERPESNWPSVPECADGCNYSIQYDAPALMCQDLTADEYTVQDYTSLNSTAKYWKFYELDGNGLRNFTTWQPNVASFVLNYAPMSSTSDGIHPPTVETFGTRTGSRCRFRDGRYQTRFTYEENVITLNTTIVSYTNSFTNNCTTDDLSNNDGCRKYGINALDICYNFAYSFPSSLSVDLTNGASTDLYIHSLIVQKIASYSTNTSGDGSVYFKPKFSNLTEALPEFFANLTVSFMPWLNATTEVEIEVQDSGPTWNYDAYQLWEVYAPVLGAVLIVGLYGFFCIHANSKTGRGMDNKFSTFLKTMRNEELDEVYRKARDFDDLLGRKLVYARSGYFIPEPKEKEVSRT